MYHTLVKRIIGNGFRSVNEHNYGAILSGVAPNVRHRFGGDHALGGERNDVKALTCWFERLGRVLPNLELTVTDMWVKGLPYDTTAIACWDARATLADGSDYRNRGVHMIKLSGAGCDRSM